MSSQQDKVKCAGDRCHQLKARVLDRGTDAAPVAQYKSFQKRMKAERNAFAGEHIDDTQLQENLRQLRTEKDECACRIEVSIRQSGSQALERVEQGPATTPKLEPSSTSRWNSGSLLQRLEAELRQAEQESQQRASREARGESCVSPASVVSAQAEQKA